MMKRTIIFLVLISVVFGQVVGPNLPIGKCPNPLPDPSTNWSSWGATDIPSFTLDSGSTVPPKQKTSVQLCYTQEFILVKYTCNDDNIYNPYTQCNDPLFKYDTVEMFIGPDPIDGSINHHYLELELSPNGVLFASNITNSNGLCSGINGIEIPCAATGIKYESKRHDIQKYWWGFLQIPRKLVDSFISPSYAKPNSYRANMFRIDIPKNSAYEYSCWSSTLADPPCFHKPKRNDPEISLKQCWVKYLREK